MRLIIVDYVGNPGGGVRFTAEMVAAFAARRELQLELVSHGEALERYRAILPPDRVAFRDLPHRNHWTKAPNWPRWPMRRFGKLTRRGSAFHFDVPAEAFAGADLVWLPWIHTHRVPNRLSARVVGSLHDLILLEFKDHVHPRLWRAEEKTVRRWLRSRARIVVSSRATVAALGRLFGAAPERTAVVPLSGMHRSRPAERAPADAPFLGAPYLLCPANTHIHKNHEVLLDGVGAWAGPHPLVLTGHGTGLASERGREARLRERAAARGLVPGRNLFGMGYRSDPEYFHLLRHAWALVMPTRAEGGGSFPVLEALLAGVPVICSDIPVMREMLGWTGGEVQWFHPDRPEELAERLRELEAGYPRFRRRAEEQVASLHQRTWDDVTADYARILGLPGAPAPSPVR